MARILNSYPNIFNISSAFKEKPKLFSGEPPEKLSPKMCFGNYCFRARVTMHDENDHVIKEFNGYSEDIHQILDDTSQACERRRSSKHTCANPSLMFVQDVPNCKGLVSMYDYTTKNYEILTYGNHSK